MIAKYPTLILLLTFVSVNCLVFEEPIPNDPNTLLPSTVQQQMKTKKLELVKSTKLYRKQYKGLILNLVNDIETAKNNLIAKHDFLNSAVAQTTLEATRLNINITDCVTEYQITSMKIDQKIDNIELNTLDESESLKSLSKNIGNLYKQIGYYKSIGDRCQPELGAPTSAAEMEDCATGQIQSVGQATLNATNGVVGGFQSVQKSVTDMLEEKSKEIEHIIAQATKDFAACLPE